MTQVHTITIFSYETNYMILARYLRGNLHEGKVYNLFLIVSYNTLYYSIPLVIEILARKPSRIFVATLLQILIMRVKVNQFL